MRHLMTYEGLFDFFKKKVERTDSDSEIMNTCRDILLELSDVYGGYQYTVDGYRRHKGNILLKKPDQNKYLNEIEIKIWRTIPEYPGWINNQQRKSIFKHEIKPIYDRLDVYLKAQGFKLKNVFKDEDQSAMPYQNPVLWLLVATS